jgi:hypothetical protein
MGKGCAIYGLRPRSCKEWTCVWLTDPELPSNARPDRCHVVFDSIPDMIYQEGKPIPVVQARCDPKHPGAFRVGAARRVIEHIGRTCNWPVLVTTGEEAIVVYTGRGKWEEQRPALDLRMGGDPVDRFLKSGYAELLADQRK